MQELHKQTVRHACWLPAFWCFSHCHLSAARRSVPGRMGVQLADTYRHPKSGLGGSLLLGSSEQCWAGPPRQSAAQEVEGTVNVHVTVWLMVTASPHLCCTSCRATGNGRGIYIATLCLSKGAALHRFLCAFSPGEDTAFAFSSGPPRCL